MTIEFELADIGEGLEEAEVLAWHVNVGDRVSRDQTIVEVMTDKSNAELPSPCDGTIVALGAQVGELVPVGSVLAVIDDDADPTTGPTSDPSPGAIGSPPAQASAPDSAPEPMPSAPQGLGDRSPDHGPRQARPKASPTTRVEAQRRGIDLSTIAGTGPGGRILLSDLDAATENAKPTQQARRPEAADQPESAVPASEIARGTGGTGDAGSTLVPQSTERITKPAVQAAPLVSRTEPLRGIRRAIARNMERSWSEVPHIHAFAHIDAEPMLMLRTQLRTSGRPEFESLTPLGFFVAAVASAVRARPLANASVDMSAEVVRYHESVNVGIAVAAPQGLVVPVVHGADRQDFSTTVTSVTTLVAAARSDELTAAQHQGGTVTVTNFGSLGGEQALPLIRPPESLIFGFGSVAPRPFVIDGQVVARKTMNLVVGADHRLIDGDVATALLTHISDDLQNPINLVLGG